MVGLRLINVLLRDEIRRLRAELAALLAMQEVQTAELEFLRNALDHANGPPE